nr:Nudix family hydrolase [Oceanococcus sp. HetDA_MAG_MS8]
MRKRIRVAAGVLDRANGEYLAAQRPPGKIAAGKWEFPGGKLESGESPLQALTRELREELDIQVVSAQPLIRICHAYSDRDVEMWVYRVYRWRGALKSQDGQALYWGTLPRLRQLDWLGADGPVLQALALPHHLPITPFEASREQLIALSRRWLAKGWRVARLRLPGLTETAYHALAKELIEQTDMGWILDRCPERCAQLGAAGFHETRSNTHAQRPVDAALFWGRSVHDQQSWQLARAAGCDYVQLSPVRPTASHPQRQALGWSTFARIIAQGSLPTYALGGVGPDQLAQVHAAWGQGVSGIRDFA